MAKKKHGSAPRVITKEEFQHKSMVWIKSLSVVQSIANRLIIGGTILGCVYLGIYLPVQISAGKSTSINYLVNVAFDLKLHVWIAWAAGAGGVGLAVTERNKRLKERKEKDERIEKLEQQIDPNRSSSGLSVDGESVVTK
jgi:hypothetical protein